MSLVVEFHGLRRHVNTVSGASPVCSDPALKAQTCLRSPDPPDLDTTGNRRPLRISGILYTISPLPVSIV